MAEASLMVPNERTGTVPEKVPEIVVTFLADDDKSVRSKMSERSIRPAPSHMSACAASCAPEETLPNSPAQVARRFLCRPDVLACIGSAVFTCLSIGLLSGQKFTKGEGGEEVPFWKVAFVLACTIFMILLMTLDLPTFPSEVVLIGGACVFALADIIKPSSVLAGLSDTTVTSVAFLFPMAKAIAATGWLEILVSIVLGTPGSHFFGIVRLCLLVGPLSAIVNNTPVTAMMVPVLEGWCSRMGFDVAKFGIPLAFSAQLGGGLTLMGSPTNFAARKTYLQMGYHVGFFEFTIVAAPLYLLGVVFFAILAPRMLGEKSKPPTMTRQVSAEESDGYFRIGFRISRGAFARGNLKVDQAGFDRMPGVGGVRLVIRDGEKMWPDVDEAQAYRMKVGDLLIFRATAEGMVGLRAQGGLQLATEGESTRLGKGRHNRQVFEVELMASSTLIGVPCDTSRLLDENQAAVLGVRGRLSAADLRALRRGENASGRGRQQAIEKADDAPTRAVSYVEMAGAASLEGVVLNEGDILLLEADPVEIGSHSWASDFGIVRAIPKSTPPAMGRKRDTWRSLGAVAGAAFAIGIFVASSMHKGLASFTLTCNLIILMLFFLATGTMTKEGIYHSMNAPILLTMVGAFPLGEAIQAVGLDVWAGETLISLFSPMGPIGSFLAIYFVSASLSNLISNIAVIAMVAPVSVQMAASQGVSLRAMVVCTSLASAAVFTFPIGHQTNLMVVPLGKYGWGDFLKMGGLFQIIHGLACCLLCLVCF